MTADLPSIASVERRLQIRAEVHHRPGVCDVCDAIRVLEALRPLLELYHGYEQRAVERGDRSDFPGLDAGAEHRRRLAILDALLAPLPEATQ